MLGLVSRCLHANFFLYKRELSTFGKLLWNYHKPDNVWGYVHFGHTRAVILHQELGLVDRRVEVYFNMLDIKGINIHHPDTCLMAQHAAKKDVLSTVPK